jgi:phosphate transport system permease protein
LFPFTATLLIAFVAFYLGRHRAAKLRAASPHQAFHSQPNDHGLFAGFSAAIPSLAFVLIWLVAGPTLIDGWTLSGLTVAPVGGGASHHMLLLNDAKNLADGLTAIDTAHETLRTTAERYAMLRDRALVGSTLAAAALAGLGALLALRTLRPKFPARNKVERIVRWGLVGASTFAILVTLGIVLSLIFETIRFFQAVPPSDFLLGFHWSPQTALRADQIGSTGSFGAIPLFTGTLLITMIAMFVAGPIGLFSAVYLNFYASRRLREVAKPLLEILAGVPTVVYGYFAAISVAPFLRDTGASLGLSVASESALAAGLVMGVMIIPFISSLSDDAITAVPDALRDGSYGLGATRSETIRLVMIPAALPGIMGGFLLAFSRAIGETMIVVMAAGLAANLTANPLDAVTTVTAQIVALLTGDQEFDSAKTLSAFALGLTLFVVTLILNVCALQVVKRYRETYD